MIELALLTTAACVWALRRDRLSGVRRRVANAARRLGLEARARRGGLELRPKDGPPLVVHWWTRDAEPGRPVFRIRVDRRLDVAEFRLTGGYCPIHREWRTEVTGDRRAAALAMAPEVLELLGPGTSLAVRGGHLVLNATRVPPARAIGSMLSRLARLDALFRAPASTQHRALELYLEANGGEPAEKVLRAILDSPSPRRRRRGLERARRHPRPVVRWAAAAAEGDTETLERMALDPVIPDSVASSAARFASSAWRRRVGADRSQRPRVREEIFARPSDDEKTDPTWGRSLADHALNPEEDARIRVAAFRGLQQGGFIERAEAVALDLLADPKAGTTRLAPEAARLRSEAIDALGRFGTSRAIPVLRRMSQGAGLWAPHWHEAQQALAQLQARTGRVEQGRLSVAAPPAGELSLAEANADPQ